MNESELISIVDQEFENALGAEGGEISKERADAWSFYLSKKFGNEIEGQSQVVTSDVADVVDSIMPSLLRIFTTQENLVNFDPVGAEDEDLAQQESDHVNYTFFKRSPTTEDGSAFLTLYTWFFDALVQKNGIVKAWWDTRETVTTETYEGIDDVQLFTLLDDEELEPIERDERIVEVTDPLTGAVVSQTLHDLTFRRVRKSGKVSVENVPPEEYRISSDSRSLAPSGARMVGHERVVKRSELLDMGIDPDVVDSLPSYQEYQWSSDEKSARYDKSDDTRSSSSSDRSQDEILLREAYLKVDFDGDGRSELRQVISASGEILANEQVDRQPFHVISPQPLPHKHFGRATAEKVMDVQEVSSVLLRQYLDNLYHSNNPGHAVWEQAIGENTLDDILTTRVGKVVRLNRPVGESLSPLSVPFTAGATLPMIEYFDKAKRDRTGISSDSEGLNPDSLKNIQTTVLAQANDISKMKVEAIARIFAETGIKSLMLHIHEMLLKHQKRSEVVKLRNEWVEVDPRSWRTRYDITVNIGLGIGTREQNLLHLNAIWEKQMAASQMGGLGTMVTPMNLFNTAAEIVKNANLKSPELFFTPAQQFAPPQSDEQMQLAQQQMALTQRQQELDAQDQQNKVQKMIIDFETKQEEIAIKRQEVDNKLLIEMEKIKNNLTQMELDSEQNVPGARV